MNLQRLNIQFSEENVIVLTKRKVPVYARFIASLGPRFNFAVLPNEIPELEIFMSIEKIIDQCESYNEYFFTKIETDNLRNDVTKRSINEQSYTRAQLSIKELMTLTKAYLQKNKHVIIIPADKGGKVVILDKLTYHTKMAEHVKENTSSKNYFRCNGFTTKGTGEYIEKRYVDIISKINPYLLKDAANSKPKCCLQLKPEPYVIPRLYGYPKIHKDDAPMRPIISSVNMIGRDLSSWLLRKIQLIAQKFSKYNVLNSSDVVKSLKGFTLEDAHRLTLFDYTSMFTNIPVHIPIDIIKRNYSLIESITSVPVDIFIQALEFFTIHSTYYSYRHHIYRQCRGLIMGNCLSQILAEIATNAALLTAIGKFTANEISFIFKYVDDIFAGIHRDYIDKVHHEMEMQLKNMKIVRTDEDAGREVFYLDCIFRRMVSDKTISYRWSKKSYSSFSTLDYHSNHPVHVKKNVVREMIDKSFQVTSPMFVPKTANLLSDVLTRSNYPRSYYENLIDMHNVGNDPKPNPMKISSRRKYVACPFYKPITDKINHTIRSNNLDVNIAYAPILTNKLNIFGNMKDKRDLMSTVNSKFTLACNNC